MVQSHHSLVKLYYACMSLSLTFTPNTNTNARPIQSHANHKVISSRNKSTSAIPETQVQSSIIHHKQTHPYSSLPKPSSGSAKGDLPANGSPSIICAPPTLLRAGLASTTDALLEYSVLDTDLADDALDIPSPATAALPPATNPPPPPPTASGSANGDLGSGFPVCANTLRGAYGGGGSECACASEVGSAAAVALLPLWMDSVSRPEK